MYKREATGTMNKTHLLETITVCVLHGDLYTDVMF